MIPNKINARHVRQALTDIDRNGYPESRKARRFDLLSTHKLYPPKYVISLACKFAIKRELASNKFSGGKETNEFLKRLGFQVRARQPSTVEFVNALIKQNQRSLESQGVFDPKNIRDARVKIAASIVRRRGQPAFRRKLLKAYESRCALSGCQTVEVLEAAHIIPYKGDQTDHVTNGILLRGDVHTLFDLGLIVVDTEKMTTLLSPALIEEAAYKHIHGRKLRLPRNSKMWPNREALDTHRASGFEGE